MSEFITPYAASKLVNAHLAEQDIQVEGKLLQVRPQMIHNYTAGKVKAGERPLIKYTPESGVDREDLVRWLKAYIAKKTRPVTVLEPLDLES
jgi:hypothetical protein